MMEVMKSRQALAAAGVVLALALPAAAAPTGGSSKFPVSKLGRPYPFSDQWVTWAWAADSRPYIAAEFQVRDMLKHQSPKQVSDVCEAIARSRPSDPLAQFRWSYAAGAEEAMTHQQDDGERALTAMQGIDPGNVREYARTRYNLTIQLEPNKPHPDLDRMGNRLLAADPNDWYTRRHMIEDLCNGGEVHKAVAMGEAWTRSFPKNPMPHSTLAFAYQNLWFRDKSKGTKARAIGEYRRYIALSPATDPFRGRAAHLVSVLQSEKG